MAGMRCAHTLIVVSFFWILVGSTVSVTVALAACFGNRCARLSAVPHAQRQAAMHVMAALGGARARGWSYIGT